MDHLHDLLKNFSTLDSFNFLRDEASAIRFAEEIGLIPSPCSTPPHHCGVEMKVRKKRESPLGWAWECCREKGKKVKGRKMCRSSISPVTGTFFSGMQTPIGDYLAIVFCFILGLGVKQAHRHLSNWRKKKAEKEVDDQVGFSKHTIVKHYQRFRQFMKIILSNENLVIGGPGKTVEIDETFVTRHKYHRGRRTTAMTLTLLGLHCREDKATLFFPVDSKSKRDLWPFIRKYVDVRTSVVCTDKARQYFGIEQLFIDVIHKSTNHSIGEFVGFRDSSNTINSLENQNRLLKGSIKCRRSSEHIQTYIDSFVYRSRKFFNFKDDVGSQIQTFLNDMILIHPPYVNGVVARPLALVRFEVPTIESERIGYALPVAYN